MGAADRIARAMETVWAERARFAPLAGDLRPADLGEAYDAQEALHGRLADRRGALAGRKIALSNPDMQKMCGIDHPLFGAAFGNDVHESGSRVSLGDFVHLGLEFELALCASVDAGPREAPWTAETAREVLGEVRPAFELIEDRAADYASLDPLTMVADNAWCGGVVLGAPLPAGFDPTAGPSRLLIDGVEAEVGDVSAASPLESFAAVLNHLRDRGQVLKAGQFVITGSALRTRFPEGPGRWRYEVGGGAGAVEMEITA
jgi:2-keto-4-pentenoate hydratase